MITKIIKYIINLWNIIFIPKINNKVTTINISWNENDVYHLGKWYKYKYSDMNWRSIYLMPSRSVADKVLHRWIIIKEFWHLKYFFKTNLYSWKVKKLSTNSFKRSIVNMQEEFEDAFVNWKDTPKWEKKLNKVLWTNDNDKY